MAKKSEKILEYFLKIKDLVPLVPRFFRREGQAMPFPISKDIWPKNFAYALKDPLYRRRINKIKCYS